MGRVTRVRYSSAASEREKACTRHASARHPGWQSRHVEGSRQGGSDAGTRSLFCCAERCGHAVVLLLCGAMRASAVALLLCGAMRASAVALFFVEGCGRAGRALFLCGRTHNDRAARFASSSKLPRSRCSTCGSHTAGGAGCRPSAAHAAASSATRGRRATHGSESDR